ncbi:MAG: response regulator [Candidatus Zixiibacteriota bacterium]|nr:MAG: response regulator [candidate division Zixibacteria bacterium]
MADRILVIDDEDSLRVLYASELRREGYEVVVAADADQALALFSKGQFALAVVDIELPGMDGLELIGKLKRSRPATPLVINSAYGTYKADFKSWLADGYVIKSSDLEPLKAKIKELLTKSDKEE